MEPFYLAINWIYCKMNIEINYFEFMRNSQKRFYGDYIYFITTKTFQNFPFFREEIFCELFILNLKLAKQLKRFKLFGCVVMPDHVHLLLRPGNDFNISKVMKSIKENTSRDINYVIKNALYEGDTSTCRFHIRQMLQKYQFDFLYHQTQTPPFKWQKSFYDHVIRTEEDLHTHLNYIQRNPIKHGVCGDYLNYKWLFLPDGRCDDWIDEI